MSTIPERVDVIILGTGLTNSILAGACSRIGKSVLHLDENGYYGSDWASFTFQQLIDWIKIKYPNNESLQAIPGELTNQSRMFCLDLAPRFIYSNGEMVDLLVRSNVARYHEFKNNIRILCSINSEIQVMPWTRNEVFTSPLLPSLIDKRRLMQFIELCLKDGGGDEPIGCYLKERGLKPDLQEYIYSIAMVSPSDPTRSACEKIKKLMVATERYGRSPFLFPLYGCGEFPQSFCRLSAVFGGLYCLNTQIKTVTGGPSDYTVTFSNEDHTVKSDMLVVEPGSSASSLESILKSELSTNNQDYLARAILITRKSIVPSDEVSHISFMRIPPSDSNPNIVFLIELNSTALVCPKDFNIVYLWTRSTADADARDDLKATVEKVFKEDATEVAWSFYYRQLTRFEPKDELTKDQLPSGLYVTGPSCDDIDYASAVHEAESIFKQMCPDEEFLPRAPDPDEIIST